jgi:antitoxin VapB
MRFVSKKRGCAVETVARIFKNGRSQAVRLPKEFRFKGDRVKIRKEGDAVVLEPMEAARWPEEFWKLFTPDAEFDTPSSLSSGPIDLDRDTF